MRKLIVLALLALSIMPALGDELAPFIYYEARDGYIIERADGTDSHILGEVLTVESTQFDASWSPSGAWLAWRGTDRGGCGSSPDSMDSLYLVGSSGEHRSTFQGIAYEWAPLDDRLLMVVMKDAEIFWQIRDPIEEIASGSLPEFASASVWDFAEALWIGDTAVVVYETHAVVIHPDLTVTRITLPQADYELSLRGETVFLADGELVAHNVLTQEERRVTASIQEILSVDWLGDAGLIKTNVGWVYLSPTQFKLLPADWPFDASADFALSLPFIDWQWVREGVAVAQSKEEWMIYDFSSDTQKILDIELNRYVFSDAVLSADEKWVAYVEEGPVMIDLVADETHYVAPIAASAYGNQGGDLFWHPTQNWLIVEEQGPAPCAGTYFTQVTDGTQRYEIPACGTRGACAHWLPEQVDPTPYPVFVKSAPPAPLKVIHTNEWVMKLDWSGNILQSDKDNHNSGVTAWDVTTGEEVSPITLTTIDYSSEEWLVFGPEILGESEHYVVGWYVYDKETQEPLFTEPEIYSENGYYHHYITPDERLLVAGGGGDPLKIWSLPDGALLFDDMIVTASALSPDGESVAVGLGWDVAIYDIDTLLEFGAR